MKNVFHKFPHYHQTGKMDCGPACLRIVAKHYGKAISAKALRRITETNRAGTSLSGLSAAAEKIGIRTLSVKIDLTKLSQEAPLPCIVFWNNNHFVVLYKVHNGKYYISDPAHGLLVYSEAEFMQGWQGNLQNGKGIVLLLEATPKLSEMQFDGSSEYQSGFGLKYILYYFRQYRPYIYQLFWGVMAGSLLQLVLPFLTQGIVDVGIKNQDYNLVSLILLAQVLLFIGRTFVETMRSWILLHLSTRINISLVSDFFVKLMGLPISYFDSTQTGEIFQRINDHTRLEKLMTGSTLNVVFSFFSLLLLGAVLAIYSIKIFSVFLLGTALYFLWIVFFLRKRKDLDYIRFSQVSQEHSKTIELINGMQEIKLHNAERQMRWGWETLQTRLFKISIKSLSLEQTQSVGSLFINEIKNILMIYLAAQAVIEGEMTLGMMLSVSYIIGQLNGPVSQLVTFIHSFQDAKISLDRIAEIHELDDEEKTSEEKISAIEGSQDIFLQNVSFKYPGSNKPVLDEVSFSIPKNKVTAIVGMSGSGKTTLMKLLLGIYKPVAGTIALDKKDFTHISVRAWRDKCGVVMQEGFIFNDTIEANIAIGVEQVDIERLILASRLANIGDFIDSMPLGYNTKIGNEGLGLSTGQKQRLLIARAIYKNPDYLFFDEATSALDANNEKAIITNLENFLRNRTSVIIAHRLSTVKNADQIVVIDKGKVLEIGNHKSLIELKGAYFNLVRNQLELEKIAAPVQPVDSKVVLNFS
ncbi:MAG TPA: peptidase domain-containing ABC transporter [Ohtaekwangia sp.]|uniref:peptidase domain-containing ABC transporter n=1 Tax=Ohtaekwangia sp. TaxID=2066019 RepID=UPI002F924B81